MEKPRKDPLAEVQQWSDRKIALLTFMAGMILFTAGLSAYRFDASTIRYAKYMAELSQHPLGWFPYLNGQPDTSCMVPHALLMHWSSYIFGSKINMFTATLPSSIFAALSLSLIYLIGALEKREIGLYAVLFTIGSYYFISQARTPCPAMFGVCSMLLGYYLVSNSKMLLWHWFILPLLLFFSFIFCGLPGLYFTGVAIASRFRKKQSIIHKYSAITMLIILMSFICFFIMIPSMLSPIKIPYIVSNHGRLFILTAVSCIPFAALILSDCFLKQANIKWLENATNKIFKILPAVPFILTVAWWICCYKLTQDKSLPPLPVMVPTMILLVCGMGMFAAKDLKKSMRELVLTAAFVMSIYTVKIMIIDPVEIAYAQKEIPNSMNMGTIKNHD